VLVVIVAACSCRHGAGHEIGRVVVAVGFVAVVLSTFLAGVRAKAARRPQVQEPEPHSGGPAGN
jgi:hypothetical protein